MSDFASFVTEPFWPDGPFEAVAQWFRDNDWTEIKGDKGTVAFAGILRDLSPAGLFGQASWVVGQLAEILPVPHNIGIIVSEELPDEWEEDRTYFSVARARMNTAEYKAQAEAERIKANAARERAERDRKSCCEGMVNPDLDAFIEKQG